LVLVPLVLLLSASCHYPTPTPPEEPARDALAVHKTAPLPTILRVGSWNIEKLGHGDAKNFELVTQIIEENFDILAIVEVMQKQHGHPGYDTLMNTLGDGWTGLVTDSPRPNTGAGHAEFYAVIWRVGLAETCPGWNQGLTYYQDNGKR
jgi:hypothetical protein